MVWEREGERIEGSAHHRSVLCDRSPRCCPRRRCLRMVCMGWGVWRGGGAGRERELSDRHCRPYAAGKQQKSLSTFGKKKRVCSSSGEQRTALFVSRTLSKMSSTEATPERMVVVQQKDLTCSTYYYCAYDINALTKVRFFHTLNSF